mgnify:CR=1 FL=1
MPPPAPTVPQLFWPDDGMWYKAEVVSLNTRNRTGDISDYLEVRRPFKANE